MTTETDRSDAALLAAHQGGDPTAFGALLARHRRRMASVALGLLRDPEEAADAVQEACLSAFRAAAGFRADAAVPTWLHRIVVNACLDRIRRRQARPVTTPLVPGVEPAVPGGQTHRQLQIDIHQALGRLPVEQRRAVTLVDLHGYPPARAAAVLGVSESALKSRCLRGRAGLATLLHHHRPVTVPAHRAA